MNTSLRVERLAAGYGEVQVLWDVSLTVEAGEIVAIIGSNGAGKSTLLKTIAGLIRPMTGRISFDGLRLDERRCDEHVAAGLVLVPEGRRLFAGMSVRENLLMGALLRRNRREVASDLDLVFDLFPVLHKRQRQLAGALSGGEQQMCAIGRGLLAGPRLLMIDELSLGLAPVAVDRLMDGIRALNARHIAILLVEQDVQVALELACRAAVLDHGQIRKEGASGVLLADPEVRELYLGIDTSIANRDTTIGTSEVRRGPEGSCPMDGQG